MSDNVAAQGHLPECSVEQGTDHVGRDATIVWRNGVCICPQLRAAYDRGWNDGAGVMA